MLLKLNLDLFWPFHTRERHMDSPQQSVDQTAVQIVNFSERISDDKGQGESAISHGENFLEST